MAAKLAFVAACLGLVAVASGSFLGNSPTKKHALRKRVLNHVTKMSLSAKHIDKHNIKHAVDHVDKHTVESKAAAVMKLLKSFNVRGLDPDDLTEMESTIEMLVTQGDDPATKLAVKEMYSFIKHTMIPNRERSHAADQKWIDTRFAELKKCHWNHQMKVDMNVHAKVDSAADHKEDYQDSVAKHGECLGVLEGKELVRDAYCTSTPDAKKRCHCDGRLTGFNLMPVDCSDAPKVTPKDKKCCDAYVAHAKHSFDCENAKYDAKYAKIQHKLIMSKVCKDYDRCYAAQYKTYELAEKAVKETEKLRSWTMLYKIQCLVGEFDKGKVTKEEAQACKDKHYEEKHIEYPSVTAKAECNPEVDAHTPI